MKPCCFVPLRAVQHATENSQVAAHDESLPNGNALRGSVPRVRVLLHGKRRREKKKAQDERASGTLRSIHVPVDKDEMHYRSLLRLQFTTFEEYRTDHRTLFPGNIAEQDEGNTRGTKGNHGRGRTGKMKKGVFLVSKTSNTTPFHAN